MATALAALLACGVLLTRTAESVDGKAARGVPKAAEPAATAQSEVALIGRRPIAPAPSSTAATSKSNAPKLLASHLDVAAVADEQAPGRPSHPVTSDRQRIYRENNLNAALMGAMNVRDHQGLRALIEEYRLDYPEDTHRLQEGYSLVADCLEKLTPERQAKARDYWKAKRGSPVRRFIREHCLARQTDLAGSGPASDPRTKAQTG